MELARVISTRHTEATLVFAAVAGEEQGSTARRYMAAQMKAAGVDVQGMFSNDIVGSSTDEDGHSDPHTLRLFVEGVPTTETASRPRSARPSAARSTPLPGNWAVSSPPSRTTTRPT